MRLNYAIKGFPDTAAATSPARSSGRSRLEVQHEPRRDAQAANRVHAMLPLACEADPRAIASRLEWPLGTNRIELGTVPIGIRVTVVARGEPEEGAGRLEFVKRPESGKRVER